MNPTVEILLPITVFGMVFLALWGGIAFYGAKKDREKNDDL